MTKHQHLFPLLSIFLVVIGIALVVSAQIDYSVWLLSLVSLTYFVANVLYGYVKKELTVMRVLELGLIAIILEYIALEYLL